MPQDLVLKHIPRDGFPSYIEDPDELLRRLHYEIANAHPHDKALWGVALDNLLHFCESAGPGRANRRLCTPAKNELGLFNFDEDRMRYQARRPPEYKKAAP